MDAAPELEKKTRRTLERLGPRLEAHFAHAAAGLPGGWQAFRQRLEAYFPTLFRLYYAIYGDQYDFFYHLEDLLQTLGENWFARPDDLKALDAAREADPAWFQSEKMVGGVIYVDLFAGDLAGVREKIPYFKELGLTYLHLMPLFKVPEGENDGGYAVSSFREVNPALGSMAELAALARDLRAGGISLVLDLVFNHTACDHEWAQRALQGDPETLEYYRTYPDRTLPDAYEATMREIFPDERRKVSRTAVFTYRREIERWVWTTFHHYQWDLNYANPAVFNRMAAEMLFLANQGVEVLRLDAVAFLWKRLGTSSENQPETHLLIQAFNACARIAAPALLFKSEAIVHPDEVVRYIGPGECQLSYNPLVMALLWNSLATRKVDLLGQALRERFTIHPACAWVNYARCHDDIGWTFSDEDAARLGYNGYDHRRFLNAFFTGRFPGSFARGLPFQEDPATGDARISGTAASLAGLEKALLEETPTEIDLAVRRILLVHAMILTLGGIPLLYLGDEVGALNDYGYRQDPAKANDSRWVHRPYADEARYARRHDPQGVEGRIFQGLQRLIALRKNHPAFADSALQVMDTGSPHVLGFVRTGRGEGSEPGERVLVLANFSEIEAVVEANVLRLYGLGYEFTDLLSGEEISLRTQILPPYGMVFLR